MSRELVSSHFPASFESEDSPCLLYPAAPIGLWAKMSTPQSDLKLQPISKPYLLDRFETSSNCHMALKYNLPIQK